jgi:hypothetical protein
LPVKIRVETMSAVEEKRRKSDDKERERGEMDRTEDEQEVLFALRQFEVQDLRRSRRRRRESQAKKRSLQVRR